MNNEHSGLSLADKVFKSLEADILSGKISAESVLSENKISTALGVSRTPVREALRRLEQEDLVAFESGKLVVLGVSERDLLDIFEIRVRIEGLAARRAAETITEEQLDQMTQVVDLQEFYSGKGDADMLGETDSRFHEMIYSFCGSRVLCDTLSSLHHRIERYRKSSMQAVGRAERATAEHRAILDALKQHDPDKAEQLLVRHIENARNNIKNKMC